MDIIKNLDVKGEALAKRRVGKRGGKETCRMVFAFDMSTGPYSSCCCCWCVCVCVCV